MKKLLATLAVLVLMLAAGTAYASTTITFQEKINRIDDHNFYIGDVLFTNWDIDIDQGTTGNLVLQSTTFAPTVMATITFANPVNIEEMYISWIGSSLASDAGGSYASDGINGLLSNMPGLLAAVDMDNVTVLTFSLEKLISVALPTGSVLFNPQVILDNLTYSATPIPGAIWLLGSGLVGLVGIRRKMKA